MEEKKTYWERQADKAVEDHRYFIKLYKKGVMIAMAISFILTFFLILLSKKLSNEEEITNKYIGKTIVIEQDTFLIKNCYYDGIDKEITLIIDGNIE